MAVASGCSEELSAVPRRPSRRDSEAPRSELNRHEHSLNNPSINSLKQAIRDGQLVSTEVKSTHRHIGSGRDRIKRN